MATFDLLPAIDLRGGRVVRLRQGDFGRETAYSDDPVAVATGFVERGARWLHVVDLDGARDGTPAHREVIAAIVEAVGARASVEVAGGLRTREAVSAALESGAARAIVGTAVLEEPALAADLVETYGADRVAASLDVRDGLAVGRGWVPGSPGTPVRRTIATLVAAGVRWFEVTAIDRDGTLGGPDRELLTIATAEQGIHVIAAGGIASSADLRAVRDIGCAGAILGRALYDGTLDLEVALAAVAHD
jgi:phosphoribosylformimino-5-aminoimidazole carboxamide ribotide isomerase